MNWNYQIRQIHRWISIIFTLGVIANIAVMTMMQEPPLWVGLLALIPLIALLITGLYLFALPYVRRRS
ncbi:hypothetical protein IZ6_01920 [Terrihabitans soli]|uniref:Uncharacterized protein n=1 Tax=Terrihabitans soli TaxID=708113 RepID=A0A6S6QNG5_9HYPH|nr:hypothetical protein [Terrihabitans soli]BCJ89457.1 hypothetical protein IZ6_01920 [Terrihabitans soli]